MDALRAKEAIMQAEAKVEEWKRNFLQEWHKKEAMQLIKQIWHTAPDDLKQKFAATHPQEYAELIKTLKEK